MGKRIDAARQRNRTQTALNQQADAIRGREASSFSSTSNNPFNSPKRDNYQTYPYDYFSGADCKIFFGDIWVDDIITIQFNVNQSKVPIYGYASQLYNAVARGQVIVEGTLSIAFKETGYLNLIQGIIETQKKNAGVIIQNKVEQQRTLSELGMVKFIPRLNYIGEDAPSAGFSLNYSPNGNPQIIRQQQTIEQILAGKKAGKALSSNLLNDKINPKNRDFEDFAEVLEDTIWGDSNGNPFSSSTKLKRADEFDYLANGGILSSRKDDYSQVLNILLTFGDINDYRAEHTLVVLNDVHFVSTNMIVSPTGDPIAETYTFFARNINDSISNEIKLSINPIKLNVGNDNLTLSKLDDIDKIEQYLNQNPNDQMTINLEACLDQYGWHPITGQLELNFTPNQSVPFVDQLCISVEKAMNDIRAPQLIDASKEQYIIKVKSSLNSNDITMILEQGVINTRTYKVISPARTGFSSQSIVTREELFTDIGDLPKPLDIAKTRIDQNKAKLVAGEQAIINERLRLEGELSEVGLSDEEKALRNRQKQYQELYDKANRDDNISKWEQLRLDNATNRLDKAVNSYNTEYNKPTDERTLNRQEKDNLVDLNNAYLANSISREQLNKEREALTLQESRYETLLANQKRQEYLAARKINDTEIKKMEEVSRQQEIKRIQDQAAADGKVIDEQIAALEAELIQIEQQNQKNIDPYLKDKIKAQNEWISDSSIGHARDTAGLRSSEYGTNKGQKVAIDIGTGSTADVVRSPFAGEVLSIGKSGTSIKLKTSEGSIVEYHHIKGKNFVIGQQLQIGDPVQFNKDHLHIQTNQLSGEELESQVQTNLGLLYKPGVSKTQGSIIEQQKIKNPIEGVKDKIGQFLESIIPNKNIEIFNDEANIEFNNLKTYQDINNDNSINALDVPVISETFLNVPYNASNLYNKPGPSTLNVKFVENIPSSENDRSSKSISDGYKLVKAQTPLTKSSSDTTTIYISLKDQYGEVINPYDVSEEIEHEWTHVQQMRSWSDSKLKRDRGIPYDNRPSEIEARESASKNSQVWQANYYTNFAELLNKYKQSIGNTNYYPIKQ